MDAGSKATRTGEAAEKSFLELVGGLGLMRLVLFGFAILCTLLAPNPGTPPGIEGWNVVSTVLAPVLAPLIFMVLLLDAMMSALFMSDKEGAARARYKKAVLADLLIAAGFFLYWLPYFTSLVK